MEIGTIKMSGRGVASYTFGSETWLLCSGQAVAQAVYPALFALCGATFGAAPAGQFRLPNYGVSLGPPAMTGKVPFGATPPPIVLGAPIGTTPGLELHRHEWDAMGPPMLLAHGGAFNTGVNTATVGVTGPGIAQPVSLNGHIHGAAGGGAAPIDDHNIAGLATDNANAVNPYCAVGFYIRGL